MPVIRESPGEDESSDDYYDDEDDLHEIDVLQDHAQHGAEAGRRLGPCQFFLVYRSPVMPP